MEASKQIDIFKEGKLTLPDSIKHSKITFCFTNCVSSFKEKPMSPNEKECLFECLSNQVMTEVEMHNSILKYKLLKNSV